MASAAAGRTQTETQKLKCIPAQQTDKARGTPAKPLGVACIQTSRLIPPTAVQCGVIENAHMRLALLLYGAHLPGRQRIEGVGLLPKKILQQSFSLTACAGEPWNHEIACIHLSTVPIF